MNLDIDKVDLMTKKKKPAKPDMHIGTLSGRLALQALPKRRKGKGRGLWRAAPHDALRLPSGPRF